MARTNKRAAGVTDGRLGLELTEAQRRTILNYADLPAHLANALSAQGAADATTPFTLDELDELLDRLEMAAYRARGNEKQKVLRIVQKVAGLLGSEITPPHGTTHQTPQTASTIFQIKMTLKGIAPPIWRRIHTPDCTLEELHEITQVTMGWAFEHPYRFTIGGVDYTDPAMTSDEEVGDACGTTLSAVLPTENRRPRFSYEYDFGDEWIHQLIVEERLPPKDGVKYPICVGGQRACPPEDCGGPWSYPDLVEAIGDPDHPMHEELLEWVGGEFDPGRFDQDAVNKELRRMRTRRA
jgi:hypothetical protein